MNGNSYMELFIDVRYIHNADSTKMFHLADSSISLASESHRDLLNHFTNPFTWGLYGVDR